VLELRPERGSFRIGELVGRVLRGGGPPPGHVGDRHLEPVHFRPRVGPRVHRLSSWPSPVIPRSIWRPVGRCAAMAPLVWSRADAVETW